MNQDQRKLIPVRNHPGIYKIVKLVSGQQIDTGKFLSTRRTEKDGESIREKAVFSNLCDAKEYRLGNIDKVSAGENIRRQNLVVPVAEKYTFRKLVEEWKNFHFLTLEPGTRKLYERKLPHLSFLNDEEVEKIDTAKIDSLVRFWMTEFPHQRGRESFERELKILTVILNFYRSRKNRNYSSPIRRDHYEASTIVRKAKNEVQALEQKDLLRFLEALKTSELPLFYSLALTQFCLGLRISEACGLTWDALDFDNKTVRIEQTISWDDRTWKPSIKKYPKNGSIRYLALPDVLVEQFRKLRMERDPKVSLVFHKDGEPLNRQHIGTKYNKVLKKLGIHYVSGTHMMRRTSATHANEATGDFYAVSKVLDHSSPDITKKYVKHLSSSKRKVADALNGILVAAFKSGGVKENPNVGTKSVPTH